MTYTRLIANLTAFGVKTDQTVTEALAVIEQAAAARNAAPLDDLRARYAAGEITSDNARQLITEAAALAAASDRLHQASAAVEDAANGTLRRWLASRDATITKQLRPVFDEAAARVQVAGSMFPPGTTPAELVAIGARAVEAHEHLDEALSTLAQVRSCRAQVADCAGIGVQDVTWYIAKAASPEQLDAAERAYYGPGDAFHALAHVGFTLRLNTLDEAAKVRTGVAAVADAAEAKARDERVRDLRDEHGFWLERQTA